MDINKYIEKYYQNIDENAEVLIECYKNIKKFKNENEDDLLTDDGIKNYYLMSLVLNDYYFHKKINAKNSFIDEKKFYSDIDFLYNRIGKYKYNFDKKNKIILNVNYSNKPIDVRTILFGNDNGKELMILLPYDMSNGKIDVGIKQFLSYVIFNKLVDDGKYNEAKIFAEKEITAIKIIANNFIGKDRPNDNDLIWNLLSEDINTLIGKKLKNEMSFIEAIELMSENDRTTYVYPFITLLCNYYKSISDAIYKKYILFIIRSLPFTQDTIDLINSLQIEKLFCSLSDVCKMYSNEEEINENLLKKIDELTAAPDKQELFNTIESKYTYINFENLCEGTKKCIATGNYIFDLSKNLKNQEDFDFSASILEWCKAVENEYRDKLIEPIKKNNNLLYKLTNGNIKYSRINMLGSSKFLLESIDEIYEDEYSDIYPEFEIDFFVNLFKQIENLNEKFRTKSAHPNKGKITIFDARDCQNMVLQSQKILELISKL